MKSISRLCLLVTLCAAMTSRAQTGAISGRVLSAEEGAPLAGANVLVLGSTLGATADRNGFYIIPNIPPGNYKVRASYLGYARTVAEEVQVRLNLTTTLHFKLKEETLQGEEVTVVARRQNLNHDISASLAEAEAEQLQSLPIATIEDAVRMQAGVEPDLSIRGGHLNTVSFLIDGINLREGRTHAPITGLSYTAFEHMQVQTGGFNAEYGNVRSGLVQLVTKNPSHEHYSADIFFRYRPPQKWRFANPSVNTVITRDGQTIDEDGYDFDMTFGGPLLPLSKRNLGKLRFLASFRQKSEPYLENYDRRARRDRTAQFKLITDLKSDTKLTLTGLYANVQGMADSAASVLTAGAPSYPWGFDNDFFKREGLFKLNNLGLSDIEHQLVSATLLHTLNANTFFEIKAHRLASDYFLRPGAQALLKDRDTSRIVLWSGKFDLTSQMSNRAQIKAGAEYLVSAYGISSELNDACSTRVSAFGSAFALLCGDRVDFESPYRIYEAWSATPHQVAAYVQGKIELNGMTLNPGVRADYFNPRGTRLLFDDFSPLLGQQNEETRAATIATASAKKQFALSPRLGVAFPITQNSKLYFNYGHFRQMPQAEHLYALQQKQFFATRSAITGLGNPDIPMPRTVAYEIGYERSFREQFLLKAAAYLRDVDKQTSFRAYISEGVYYTLALPYNYNDVSGLELTASKVKGDWLRGFVNFTYMKFSSGNFGPAAIILNPLDRDEYERLTQDHYQSKAAAQPYAHFSLEFIASPKFGPRLFGGRPLSNWRAALLGEWRAGRVFTWSGPIVDQDNGTFGIQYSPHPALQNNVRTRDFYRLDLRLSKNFKSRFGSAQLFLDLNNILNLKFLYFERPFLTPASNPFADYNAYMASLHLPASAFENLEANEAPYLYISGNDRPGDFRKAGAAFVPIQIVRSQRHLPATGNAANLYYVHDAATYLQFANGAWQRAEAEFVQQVLDDKAYINMPDKNHQTFLNPRSVSLGLRFSF